MEREIYERMAEQDGRHWWFVARRQILADLLARRMNPSAEARILEIGCGTGHNFEMLGRFGTVEAIEVDDGARALAAERLGRAVGTAPLPDLTGIEDGAFDLIALLDVLEHIQEDRASLASIKRKLAPGGQLLLTVPANQWMWSAHDAAHHHHRRYSKRALARLLRDTGFRIDTISYFNTLLFPLAAAARLAGKLTGSKKSNDKIPSAPVNSLFRGIFGLERHLVGRIPLPAGVSLVAIAS